MREPGEPLTVERDAGGCPLAALALYREQVDRGQRQPLEVETDLIGVAAGWERTPLAGAAVSDAGSRVSRAYVVGRSPWTERGRRRRDREYLDLVAAAARLTLPPELAEAYGGLHLADDPPKKRRRLLAWFRSA